MHFLWECHSRVVDSWGNFDSFRSSWWVVERWWNAIGDGQILGRGRRDHHDPQSFFAHSPPLPIDEQVEMPRDLILPPMHEHHVFILSMIAPFFFFFPFPLLWVSSRSSHDRWKRLTWSVWSVNYSVLFSFFFLWRVALDKGDKAVFPIRFSPNSRVPCMFILIEHGHFLFSSLIMFNLGIYEKGVFFTLELFFSPNAKSN